MIDTHVHLHHPAFDPDREEVVTRARAAGLQVFVTLGVERRSSQEAVRLAEHFEGVYAAVGIHPRQVLSAQAGDWEALAELAWHPKVVAVGECGLDYQPGAPPMEVQQEALRWHVRLSRFCGKPLVVHNRGADEDLLRILEQEGAQRVVMHMFTGGPAHAEACAARGYWMSVGGPVTDCRRGELRRAVRAIPDPLLLVETDAPFAAPVPYRGRRNEPAYLPTVVEAVASLRGKRAAVLAALTAENARRCFGLPR